MDGSISRPFQKTVVARSFTGTLSTLVFCRSQVADKNKGPEKGELTLGPRRQDCQSHLPHTPTLQLPRPHFYRNPSSSTTLLSIMGIPFDYAQDRPENIDTILNGLDRYNPETTGVFQEYVDSQCENKTYDCYANLALLKL
jgi:hypothetical protein